jgi:hypothetical protein
VRVCVVYTFNFSLCFNFSFDFGLNLNLNLGKILGFSGVHLNMGVSLYHQLSEGFLETAELLNKRI